MSLDNILEMSTEERVKAIQEFEQNSRKRVAEVMERWKRVQQRLKGVYTQATKMTGLSEEELKHLPPTKYHLKEGDEKLFGQLKGIVDRLNILKSKETAAADKGSHVGSAIRKRPMTRV